MARELVTRWWNGTWGRLTRRDVWLAREVRWHVVARAGDSETGKVLRWEFDTEDEARQLATRLVKADGGKWREITGNATTKPPE
ncbi:hypothetical protein [Micromonospora sp. NPDC051296]|uniref:hypothetical protein n=1 Tax=Micromonospora sp. NPDC051296 TaxID=3155046 RepID=UPI003435D087